MSDIQVKIEDAQPINVSLGEAVNVYDGAVQSVNGKTGAIVLTATDVGADATGAAATAQTNAESYTDNKVAAIDFPVDSVNAKTGAVVLDKTDVGLGNVDNTSDLAKPISTASQTALNTKVDKVTGKALSTEDYTTAEKTKLAGIATAATANQTDAYLLSRANHTGTQAISTVSGLQTALDGKQATGDYATNTDLASGLAAKADTTDLFSGDYTDLTNKPTIPLATMINVLDYGAIGDGTTDDTDAINSALDSGGITFFPAGTYLVSGLTLTAGAHLLGVGTGHYSVTGAADSRSIIKLKDSSDRAAITIPTGASHGIIQDIEIDGNGANQTSGAGISFTANTDKDEADWQLRGVEIYGTYDDGIYVGANRLAVYADRILVTSAGRYGVNLNAADSTWVKPMIGLSGGHNFYVNGYVARIIGGDIWSAANDGIYVNSAHVSIMGTGIDHNGENGIEISSIADHVTITGCAFHSNSQATDNTYSDILLSSSNNDFNFIGNQFGSLDSGITKKRKYALAVGANNAVAVANSHTADATGTEFTDTPNNIALPVASGGTGSGSKNFVDNYSNQTINGDKTFSSKITVKSGQEIDVFDSSNVELLKFFHDGTWGTINSSTGFVLSANSTHTAITGSNGDQLVVQFAGGSYNSTSIGHDDTNGTITTNAGDIILNPSGRVRLKSGSVPASASSTGTMGQIAWDSGYIYVCTATNTWKRTPLASW